MTHNYRLAPANGTVDGWKLPPAQPYREPYTADELRDLPDLCIGQADSLKIESDSPRMRVWLSRCTVDDGEPYNDKITIEAYVNDQWVTINEYPG